MFSLLMIATLAMLQDPRAPDLSQPPRLRNAEAVIELEDYPTESLRRLEFGIVTTLLRVSAEGKVTACEVTEKSGSATLDMTTCLLLKKRARFDPARDATGSPIEGEYRQANAWGVNEHQPRTTVDIPLQVSAIPSDYRAPVKARLIFDAMGRVTACEITTRSGSAAADRAACSYIKQELVISAPKSASRDVPAVAVRYLSASLSTQPVGPSAKR